MTRMKNKALRLTASSVPYIKELRAIAGSMVACLLMQQLDYWFAEHEDGFYKFLEPAPNHPAYRRSDSWCEEMGMTPDEFRTAFDKIGIRYTSRTSYEKALASGDAFIGKCYLSYFSKIEGKTYYRRNHSFVDAALDRIFSSTSAGDGKRHIRESDETSDSSGGGENQLRSSDNPDTEMVNDTHVDSQVAISVTGKIHPDITEITPKTTHRLSTNSTTNTTPAASIAPAPVAEPSVVALIQNENDEQIGVQSAIASMLQSSEIADGLVYRLGSQRPKVSHSPLVAALVAKGVSQQVAEDLVADYPDRIQAQLFYLPYADKVGNPGGYLRSAIECNYSPPPRWVAEQEAQARRERERAQAEAQTAARDRENDAKARLSAACDAMWADMDDEERQELEQRVMAQLHKNPLLRKRLEVSDKAHDGVIASLAHTAKQQILAAMVRQKQ